MGRHAVSDPTAHPTMGSFAAAVFGVQNNATQHQRGVSKAEAVPTCTHSAALRAVPAKGRAVSSHRTSQPNPGGIGGFWGGFSGPVQEEFGQLGMQGEAELLLQAAPLLQVPPQPDAAFAAAGVQLAALPAAVAIGGAGEGRLHGVCGAGREGRGAWGWGRREVGVYGGRGGDMGTPTPHWPRAP